RSRADAAVMAATLKRLLEQQGGVKVEVISADQLLKDGDKQPEKAPEKPAGHGDAGGMPRGWMRTVLGARALGAIAAAPTPQKSEVAAATDQPTVTIAVDPATNSLVVV